MSGSNTRKICLLHFSAPLNIPLPVPLLYLWYITLYLYVYIHIYIYISLFLWGYVQEHSSGTSFTDLNKLECHSGTLFLTEFSCLCNETHATYRWNWMLKSNTKICSLVHSFSSPPEAAGATFLSDAFLEWVCFGFWSKASISHSQVHRGTTRREEGDRRAADERFIGLWLHMMT